MNEAEHDDVVVLKVVRVHGAPVNDPVAVPPLLNETVPPGAVAVPVPISFTNAVQLVACETTIADGAHDTVMVVGLPPTVTVLLLEGPLPLWAVSVEA